MRPEHPPQTLYGVRSRKMCLSDEKTSRDKKCRYEEFLASPICIKLSSRVYISLSMSATSG